MNHIKCHLITLFLFLFLIGCNESANNTVSVKPQSKEDIVQDSLQKLDSLVLKYIAKNADESIKYAKQAFKVSQTVNTPAGRAKAYKILGNAYSAVIIDSGFYFYHKALAVIDSFNLNDEKGKVLYNLGILNRSAGNYKNYKMLIDSALRFSIQINDFATMSNSLNSLGGFYYNIGEKVIARKMFDSAFAIAKRKLFYLQMGSALGNLARFENNLNKSVTMLRQAISYLEKSNGSDEQVAQCLINIGFRISDSDSALHYYNQAINMVSVEYSPVVTIGAYNNMAYCYLGKGDLKNAEKCILEHALPVAIRTNNIDWQSTVYDTYADILQRKGNSTEARVYKKKALEAKETYRALVSPSLISTKNN
jgi:tetratricopeptide (TPR) repeat protein